MKLQLIETPDYILTVSDEKMKEGDTIYANGGLLDGTITNAKSSDFLVTNCWVKIIAHTPKNNSPELDLPLLPEMVVEDDVEKLWLDFNKNHNRDCPLSKEQFVRAISYKSATKVYSEDGLRKAFEAGMYFIGEDKGSYEEFIQSLKQSKTPKWFVAEKEYLSNDGNWKNVLLPSEWGYDTQVRFKTSTINNKTYLVGHYEY
jgi:predicted ribosome quality control (RQC) complex YloA/Tae2 family protein